MPESIAPGRRDPVVLWSPGLGGDLNGGAAWATAWVKAGMAVVHLQHPGSGPEVYADPATPSERHARMVAATAPEQLMARVGDAGFILDELGRRKREGACDLTQLDPGNVAIAGHSMGAWVAQAIAGQRFGGGFTLADGRFRAALAFSPTAQPGSDLKAAFGGVVVPFMVITGTADGAATTADAATRAAALAARTAAYEGMPRDGSKYLLVVDNAEHMMFAGNSWRARTSATAAHVQAVGQAVTTAFLGASLRADRDDSAALAKGFKGLLGPGDRWSSK